MARKILIDLEKFRTLEGRPSDEVRAEGMCRRNPGNRGLISIREWAAFMLSCRRCSAAPCIDVCPAQALEKDEKGIIVRATNLCIACKSCVVICPFGTLMNDFFRYHGDRDHEYDLTDARELEILMKEAPEGAVILTDQEEDPDKHIYRLTEQILVKERTWEQINR
jgi:Fe-S-cluster-containing dehydrogenase component